MEIEDIIKRAVEREHREGKIKVWRAEKRVTFEDRRRGPCHRIDREISRVGWSPNPPFVTDEKGNVTVRPPDEIVRVEFVPEGRGEGRETVAQTAARLAGGQ